MRAANSQSSLDKRSKYKSEQGNVDRLSNLPESILFHILSLVDTKCVVQTSILSTFWRDIWTRLPSLNIDWNYHCSCDHLTTNDDFTKFVSRVLVHRSDSCIQKFQLVCGAYWDPDQICKWIEVVVTGNLQELRLEITQEQFDVLELPPSLFTCTSLKIMELQFHSSWPCIVLSLPPLIRLPRLKILHLSSAIFWKGIQRLFSSCPVLETLSLTSCTFYKEKNLNITAHQLKDLVIEDFLMRSHLSEFKVKIHTPRLTSFRCGDFMVNNYTIGNFSSLVDADIDMSLDCRRDPEGFQLYFEEKRGYGRRVINTFVGLRSAKALKLSSWSLQFLSEVMDELENQARLFHNLRCLTVTTFCSSSSYRALTYLLKSLPNIETLFLRIDQDFCPSYQDCKTSIMAKLSTEQHDESWEKELLSQCVLNHVKCVEIQEFKGCKIEVEFVSFLLKSAVTLEKLVIINHKASSIVKENPLEEFNGMLRSFPRASPSVAVSFSCHGNK